MPLDQYMALCNQKYYNSKDPLGTSGDFITAPEISQIFGEIIAAWLVDMMGHFGSEHKVKILECGPGRGTLMSDILRILSKIKALSGKYEVILLENSDSLTQVQRSSLKDYDVTWVKNIQDVSTVISTGPLFILGNEFLDALPIKQFVYKGGGWFERYVEVKDNETMSFKLMPTDFAPPLKNSQEGDIFENSPAIKDFIRTSSSLVQHHGGGMLWIDYGYHQTAFGDTFQALKDHKYTSPLENAGQSDLTAHINFETVGDIAKDHQLHVYGPTTQGQFLNECGIFARADMLKKAATEKQRKDIDVALHRLTAPEQMGTLFKVIAATSKQLPLAGFGA